MLRTHVVASFFLFLPAPFCEQLLKACNRPFLHASFPLLFFTLYFYAPRRLAGRERATHSNACESAILHMHASPRSRISFALFFFSSRKELVFLGLHLETREGGLVFTEFSIVSKEPPYLVLVRLQDRPVRVSLSIVGTRSNQPRNSQLN